MDAKTTYVLEELKSKYGEVRITEAKGNFSSRCCFNLLQTRVADKTARGSKTDKSTLRGGGGGK